MLPKPQMKREVAVVGFNEMMSMVYVYATTDALVDLKEFGEVRPYDEVPNKYVLEVDGRYNLREVVNWIETNWEQ